MRLYSMFAAAALFVAGTVMAAENVQEVVTEGVGKTADDAVKDALRSAVREVLGTVVDQETRLKNDKVIDEKVLTASSGFVTGYERIGQPKEEGGLVRVKIKAKVERSELVDKLRELKITVTKVDSAKVTPRDTDLRFSDERFKQMGRDEMVANKAEIIQDALVDLPKVLEARAKSPDRFDFDAAKSSVNVEVQLAPDSERYIQFLKRLQMRLDKLALRKVVAVADGAPKDIAWERGVSLSGFRATSKEISGSVDLRNEQDVWVLWVLTDVLRNGSTTRWAGYYMDADPRKVFAGLQGSLHVQVALRDADGKSVTEDTFETKDFWLGSVSKRKKEPGAYHARSPRSLLLPWDKDVRVTQELTVQAHIAPFPVVGWWGGSQGAGDITRLDYVIARPHQRSIRIQKEELARVKDIRCAVVFRPEK